MRILKQIYMTSKDKISILSTVWNATFGKNVEPTTDETETKATEMAAEVEMAKEVAPADMPAEEADPAVDMMAKLDEVLAAIAALADKVNAMEAVKVAMSAIKETVGGLIEANTIMSTELIEMKNIPMGDVAGKTKSEDKTTLEDKSEKKFTSTYENLVARLADRNKN